MDTTETNIKMCDCEEIQGSWKPQIGDYTGGDWFIDQEDNIGKTFLGIVRGLNPEGHSDCVDCGGAIFWATESNTWLPRQDQLQILSGLSWQEFDKECLKYDAATKEQAGIQVVMEKYNKVWNGEEWVK